MAGDVRAQAHARALAGCAGTRSAVFDPQGMAGAKPLRAACKLPMLKRAVAEHAWNHATHIVRVRSTTTFTANAALERWCACCPRARRAT